MEPREFIEKWRASERPEKAAAQQHFLDLCALLEVPKPGDPGQHPRDYDFEKRAIKSDGRDGRADVWRAASSPGNTRARASASPRPGRGGTMWNRDWTTYLIKAVFEEKTEAGVVWPDLNPTRIREYKDSILEGWEAHIYKVPNPILVSPEVSDIVEVKRETYSCRVYPPFQLNELRELSGTFEAVEVPTGIHKVASLKKISESAVKGVKSEHNFHADALYTQGIRLDCQRKFPEDRLLKDLLDQIVQYTHQWWLRSPQSPFRGPFRLGAAIDRSFNTLDELRYHGAGKVESSWYGARQTQRPFGFERPVTRNIWLLCLNNIKKMIPADLGLLSFSDALADYMAGESEKCILDLSICFEILANKRLIAEGKKPESSIGKILRRSSLVGNKAVETIRRLSIDRDHIAHGRPPYVLGSKGMTIEIYLDAIREVVNQYLHSTEPGKWPEMAALRLPSTLKR